MNCLPYVIKKRGDRGVDVKYGGIIVSQLFLDKNCTEPITVFSDGVSEVGSVRPISNGFPWLFIRPRGRGPWQAEAGQDSEDPFSAELARILAIHGSFSSFSIYMLNGLTGQVVFLRIETHVSFKSSAH